MITDEKQVYRIVRKHIDKIMASIPFENMNEINYPNLITSNITVKEIEAMYQQMYSEVGFENYKKELRKIDKLKNFNINQFTNVVAVWLRANAGKSITSVHSTLIETVLDIIEQGYEENISTVDIARLLQRSLPFYKNQMIRIARTEGTTITNSATVMAADESPFEMEKVWIAAMDDRVRPDHAEMNFVKVGQYAKFIVGGEELDYPGDIDASAGQRINCRCAVSLIGKRDSNGNLIPKGN